MPKATPSILAMQVRKYAPRQGVLLLLAAGFVALFYDRLSGLDFSIIWGGFHAVGALQWAGALLATGCSFWAVGRYDAVVHRILATGTCEKQARRAGIAGIAISQTLGMGVFTGALVRWRMLPDVSLWQAMRLSAAVALSFLAGWAVVTGVAAALFSPMLSPWLALVPLAAVGGLIMASLFAPPLVLLNRRIQWPTLPAILSIIGLSVLDTVAAAAALYILLPDVVGLSFATLYPAFLLALGAALVSGTPGGVGPFEVTLLALLPDVGAEPVLGAVLAFRAVYYALPALLGLALLARGAKPAAQTPATLTKPAAIQHLNGLISNAPFAEANLLRQGDKMLLSRTDKTASLIVSRTGQTLTALRDPLNPQHVVNALQTLRRAAQTQARIPCLYKCSARTAAHARRMGFRVLPIAQEVWLDPREFTPDTPNHRQLRRKLRKSTSAGITVTRPDTLPLPDMVGISDEWVRQNGGERRFSMGVFARDFVQNQRVYLAMQNGQLQGFITLNTCHTEWSLDLMRQRGGAPDGTMHALLMRAIQDAATTGIPRLSLAALPFPHQNRLLKRILKLGTGHGLRQFKMSFAPNRQTLYIAAPNRAALCLAGFDIARAISPAIRPPQDHYD
jgi:phosphatidylglycerol lysyltransferase